jgi:predicted dehydrogenase
VWNPDIPDTHDYFEDWQELPANDVFENGFKVQWESFLRHILEDAPYDFDLLAGARGVRLSEEGLRSSVEGRRIELNPVSL